MYSFIASSNPGVCFAPFLKRVLNNAGIPALVRGVGKRFMRNRDAVNPELDDAIREYMRD